MLDTGCWILDAGYWMLDTGCWILDAGYWMLDTGFRKKRLKIQYTRLKIQVFDP
jgi:hypothetical protein